MSPRAPGQQALGRQAGFTLVELIAVLVILAIVAVIVLPRFSSTESHRNLLLKDQLIAIARVAQQTAMSRYGQPTALQLSRPADWLFEVRVDTDRDGIYELTVKQLQLKRGGASLSLVTPVAIAIDNARPVRVGYDHGGHLSELNGAAVNQNLYFQAADRGVCISLAGHAYQSTNRAECENN